MEVLYHGIKTRYAYDFPLCFPHELIMFEKYFYSLLLLNGIKEGYKLLKITDLHALLV